MMTTVGVVFSIAFLALVAVGIFECVSRSVDWLLHKPQNEPPVQWHDYDTTAQEDAYGFAEFQRQWAREHRGDPTAPDDDHNEVIDINEYRIRKGLWGD